ncbi:MAG: OmpP1/FadL family transporter [Betaproteobacteria bacterium]
MRGTGSFTRWLAWTLTLGIVVLPTPVFASGFQLIEQNASGLGNAFAGQAAGVKNASAVYFNPAAMTRVKGWNFVLSTEAVGLGTTFTDSGSGVPFAPFPTGPYSFPVPLGSNGGDAGKWIPVPNGYLAGQVTDRIWLGVGVNVPFGLETDWAADWLGRFHATKSKVQTINVNPSIALQLSDTLSVGGGVNYQHLTADFNQGVAYGGLAYAGTAQAVATLPAAVQQAAIGAVIAQLGSSGRALEGAGLISGDSNAWGWNAGALVKLGEQAQLGVSYRSKIKHDITGDVTFEGAPRFSLPGALEPIGAGLNARFANGPVKTTIDLPDTWSFAGAWENDELELLADWTWTGWSSIPTLAIERSDGSALSSVPLQFQDTWRAGLGANVKLNDRWTLRLGAAYDKAPVQDQYRTPRLPDNHRVWTSGGFQWRPSQKASVDVGYTHIFVKDGPSSLPNQDTPSSPPIGALVGTYNAKVDILGAQITLHF